MNVATWSTYEENEEEKSLYGNKKVEKKMRLTKELSIVSHGSLIKGDSKEKRSSVDVVEEVHDDHSNSSFE